MLKYVSKFTLDVLPSVLATIIGAYIVNHYIVAKPDTPAVAAVSTSEPKAEAKVSETARGSGRRVFLKKPSSRNRRPRSRRKSLPRNPRTSRQRRRASLRKPDGTSPRRAKRPRPSLRPRRRNTAAPAVAPVIAAPATAPPAETAAAPEEHRDANDLARAAIERLRGVTDGSPRAQEAARVPEAPRAPDAARVPEASRVAAAPAVRPLPPPIMVSTPAGDPLNPSAGSSAAKQPDGARIDDPRRPTPPADIPAPPSQPLDLRAEAAEPATREHNNVAEDMLSAAKSVFHAVLPK